MTLESMQQDAESSQDLMDRLYRAVAAAGPLEGWTLDSDGMSGSWFWARADRPEIAIFATPWWEGSRGIPVDIIDDEGEVLLQSVLAPLDRRAEDQEIAAAYRQLVGRLIRGLHKIGGAA